MENKSVDQCLLDIFKDIELRKHVDFGSKASVRRYNAASDRIRKNFKYIDQNYPQNSGVIVNLLEHPDSSVVTHCAVVMQDLLHCSLLDKRKAIERVKQLLADEGVDTPDKIWLSLIWIKQAERNLEQQEQGDDSPVT